MSLADRSTAVNGFHYSGTVNLEHRLRVLLVTYDLQGDDHDLLMKHLRLAYGEPGGGWVRAQESTILIYTFDGPDQFASDLKALRELDGDWEIFAVDISDAEFGGELSEELSGWLDASRRKVSAARV